MTTKVLLDTDIGSDIDDAVALAYLLSHPECELLGITTVSGEVVKRAQLASVLCRLAGRDIPIYPGRAEPLLHTQRQPHAPQAAALARWDHATEFPSGQAVAFLQRTIREHPGEIDLLAIGPMTNIAALFAADEEIPRLLKSLVLMCGAFTDHPEDGARLEWNSLCDPHAAAIVYQSGVPIHRSVGLDVTQRVEMGAPEVRERFQTKLLRPVLDFAEVWFQSQPVITFHDPLAAATLFDDQICQFERGLVEVDTVNPQLAGLTGWQAQEGGPHEIALGVDGPRFFEHYFDIVH